MSESPHDEPQQQALQGFNRHEEYHEREDELRKDTIKVSKMSHTASLESPEGTGLRDRGRPVEATEIVRVAGCAFESVNGRYLQFGSACGALRFRNVNGWVIFRHAFQEIPELNILAENCYSALKGPSMTELQEIRASA